VGIRTCSQQSVRWIGRIRGSLSRLWARMVGVVWFRVYQDGGFPYATRTFAH
jgi:hypothetical protein